MKKIKYLLAGLAVTLAVVVGLYCYELKAKYTYSRYYPQYLEISAFNNNDEASEWIAGGAKKKPSSITILPNC